MNRIETIQYITALRNEEKELLHRLGVVRGRIAEREKDLIETPAEIVKAEKEAQTEGVGEKSTDSRPVRGASNRIGSIQPLLCSLPDEMSLIARL